MAPRCGVPPLPECYLIDLSHAVVDVIVDPKRSRHRGKKLALDPAKETLPDVGRVPGDLSYRCHLPRVGLTGFSWTVKH